MTQLRIARPWLWALTLSPVAAFAATPRLDDYARGVAIEATMLPIVEIELPDAVYRTTVSDDLSDLRVFNGDGIPVPHALCVASIRRDPTIFQASLPVYRLQDVPRNLEDGTRVEVQTPSGAQIRVEGDGGVERRDVQVTAYVIDARALEDEMRALQFSWSSPDGASEVRVSIQASNDLDRWRTLVASTTLVKLESGGQALGRQRVTIPQARYDYLRIERVDRGPPLQLDEVAAELVTPAPIEEPRWFGANVLAVQTDAAEFDADRRAPIAYARLTPTYDNTSLQIVIESRAEPEAGWTRRWTGEVYSILTQSERRDSPPAEFTATNDRYWRIRPAAKGEEFHQQPLLELGYRPARLRFLTQGEGPYTLAFGSRRADAATPRSCDGLLANLPAAERDQSIGDGYVGAERSLGGDDALRPLPKPTPLRQIVLWGTLVLGAAVLIAMALSLLRRIKPDGTTER